MYNEDLKREYITFEDDIGLKNLFVRFEKLETKMNKDLYDMTLDEIMDCISSVSQSETMAYKYKLSIDKYLNWCRIKGYTHTAVLKGIGQGEFILMYRSRVKELYISPEQFEYYINRIMVSDYGIHIASFIHTLYEGIDGQNYANLSHMRVGDIDSKKSTINLYSGEKRKVSKELIEKLMQTSETRSITTPNGVYKLTSSLYPDSIWSSHLKEVSEDSMGRRFRGFMTITKKICDEPRLSRAALVKSGYFNKMIDIFEKDGMKVSTDMLNQYGRDYNSQYKKYFDEEQNYGYNVSDVNDMKTFIKKFYSYLQQTNR